MVPRRRMVSTLILHDGPKTLVEVNLECLSEVPIAL